MVGMDGGVYRSYGWMLTKIRWSVECVWGCPRNRNSGLVWWNDCWLQTCTGLCVELWRGCGGCPRPGPKECSSWGDINISGALKERRKKASSQTRLRIKNRTVVLKLNKFLPTQNATVICDDPLRSPNRFKFLMRQPLRPSTGFGVKLIDIGMHVVLVNLQIKIHVKIRWQSWSCSGLRTRAIRFQYIS